MRRRELVMKSLDLVRRGLSWHWRTNLAVVAGVATAVAVLTGALLVGDSVRASLRRLALERLGSTEWIVSAPRFVGEGLARRVAEDRPGARAVGLVAVRGSVLDESTGRRIGSAMVYGVDETFWAFHGRKAPALGARDAWLSPAAADELQARGGASLVLKLEAEGDVPGNVLFGRRDALGRTLRVEGRGVLGPDALGEFALRPDQQAPLGVFVSLPSLQRALEQSQRVNTILVAGLSPDAPDAWSALPGALTLEDHGLKLRELERPHAVSLESRSALVSPDAVSAAAAAATALQLPSQSVLAYLANEIRIGDRSVPYSLVASVEDATFDALRESAVPPPDSGDDHDGVLLNDWAARDLAARVGDTVSVEYYVWLEEGRLETRTATFRLEAIVPMKGLAADPDLTPAFPGISDSLHLSDWDPPFPVDLSKVRPADEKYWDEHKTTPKAFLRLARGAALFGHRLGRATSVRIDVPRDAALHETAAAVSQGLATRLAPARSGILASDVRRRAEEASSGTTDFGAYFLYFSFFLVVSALLLAALFFRLGVESRQGELGLLGSVGFNRTQRGRPFIFEGVTLAVIGAILGTALSALYTRVVLWALSTVWVGAVGTHRLALEPAAPTLLLGFAAGVASSVAAILFTLRSFRRASSRALLAGAADDERLSAEAGTVARWSVLVCGLGAAVLLGLAILGRVAPPAAFFGAGGLALVGGLSLVWFFLRRTPGSSLGGRLGLAVRGASHRPGRTLLSAGLVAAATFILVAVSAFRHDGGAADVSSHHGPAGGYPLMAQSLVGLHHDLGTIAGREALGLVGSEAAVLEGTSVASFRLRDGDDPSCLNLYAPGDPRILGAPVEFLRQGRFAFAKSLATTPEQQRNPWLLLEEPPRDGVLAAVADANTLEYVLHKKVGDEIVLSSQEGLPAHRLRIVGALQTGLLQGELVVGEAAFVEAFPAESGRRFFLIEAPVEKSDAVGRYLESRLGDAGFDVSPTKDRLARYFAVENTYIATFQTLGAFGLLLGTLGLGAALLRNAAERRRELGLLAAVGYAGRDVRFLILAENVAVLVCGLVLGTGSALLAIAPAWISRQQGLSWMSIASFLLVITLTGFAVSWLAASMVRRAPLLAALRSE